jgi:manganese-dependent ADP-ribose/CDP-alcohol diphosphatase
VAILQCVLAAFDGLGRPTYHMLANHDLVNLPRAQLNALLRIPPAPGGASFYSFQPHPAWRFVVLDAYDVSLLGWDESHPRHKEAEALLHQHNPNKVGGLTACCQA